MKIRQGFVSNSSSSSFIIVADSKKKLKTKITIDVDFNDFVDETFNNSDSFIKYLKEYYGLTEEEIMERKHYIKAIEAINKGNTVYIGEVASDNDNALETYLYEKGLPSKIDDAIIISE